MPGVLPAYRPSRARARESGGAPFLSIRRAIYISAVVALALLGALFAYFSSDEREAPPSRAKAPPESPPQKARKAAAIAAPVCGPPKPLDPPGKVSFAGVCGPAGAVVFTNDVYSGYQDGAGSQLSKIILTYKLALGTGAGFIQNPLIAIHAHGEDSQVALATWDSFVSLPSLRTAGCSAIYKANDGCVHVLLAEPYWPQVHAAIKRHCPAGNSTRLVVHLQPAVLFTTETWLQNVPLPPAVCWAPGLAVPDAVPPPALPAGAPAGGKAVAVHMRRGDVLHNHKCDRCESNAYFINTIASIAKAEATAGRPPPFVTFYADTAIDAFDGKKELSDAALRLDEIDAVPVPHAIVRGGDPRDALRAFVRADIFVASTSLFSLLAALLRDPGVGEVILSPRWINSQHTLRSDWRVSTSWNGGGRLTKPGEAAVPVTHEAGASHPLPLPEPVNPIRSVATRSVSPTPRPLRPGCEPPTVKAPRVSFANTCGPGGAIVFTFDAESGHRSSAGSQVSHTLEVYKLALATGAGFIQSPLLGIHAHGELGALDAWNAFLDIPSLRDAGCAARSEADDGCDHYLLNEPEWKLLTEVIQRACPANGTTTAAPKKVVIHLKAWKVFEAQQWLQKTELPPLDCFAPGLSLAGASSPSPPQQGGRTVAVHVRRGDVFRNHACDRCEPNEYFVAAVSRIAKEEAAAGRPPPFVTFFVDTSAKAFDELETLSDADLLLNELDAVPLPHAIVRGGDSRDAVRGFVRADYLVASYSALSYLGALLRGTAGAASVILPPRWRANPYYTMVKGWRFASPDGATFTAAS